jgi:tetratricopeptide (TPR) repeat protein
MKTTLYALAMLIGMSGMLKAQDYGEDSAKCRENLYIYYELAKKKQWLEAYDNWIFVYENCPQSSKNNFIYGPYIVNAKIKEAKAAKNDTALSKYRALLMSVYDSRNKYYPGKEGYVFARKALDMLKHYPDSLQSTYQLFNDALRLDGPEQSAAFYNYFFVTAAKLFNEKLFEVNDVFEAYNVVMEGLEVNNNSLNLSISQLTEKRDSNGVELDQKEQNELQKAERELDRYTKVESNIEKILGPIATCEKLNLIYNPETFAANSTDTLWLNRATKMLQKERRNEEGEYEDCTDNPIFFDISDALYKLEPAAPSARAMFVMAYRNKEYSKSAQYIKEAISYEIDPLKRSSDYVKLASIYIKLGSLSAAKNAGLKAAALDKSNGDAYMVIASTYALAYGTCGANVFEKKAVYWAAINKLKTAKSVDPSLSAKANRLIAAYQKQLPDKGLSFQLGHTAGEQYTIACFINETITVEF